MEIENTIGSVTEKGIEIHPNRGFRFFRYRSMRRRRKKNLHGLRSCFDSGCYGFYRSRGFDHGGIDLGGDLGNGDRRDDNEEGFYQDDLADEEEGDLCPCRVPTDRLRDAARGGEEEEEARGVGKAGNRNGSEGGTAGRIRHDSGVYRVAGIGLVVEVPKTMSRRGCCSWFVFFVCLARGCCFALWILSRSLIFCRKKKNQYMVLCRLGYLVASPCLEPKVASSVTWFDRLSIFYVFPGSSFVWLPRNCAAALIIFRALDACWLRLLVLPPF